MAQMSWLIRFLKSSLSVELIKIGQSLCLK